MADKVTAGKPKDFDGGENKFPPHPAGPAMMVCVDVIDLGEKVTQYQNNPPKLVPKVALVFCSGKKSPNGDLWEVTREFTVSTGRKSQLRPFLDSWKGEPLKGDYPDVQLDKLVGFPAYCVISHVVSESTGYTYANLTTIAPLPPGTPKPKIEGYKRLERWEKKRTQYKQDADAFRDRIGATEAGQPAAGFDAPPPPAPEDDESLLPFD